MDEIALDGTGKTVGKAVGVDDFPIAVFRLQHDMVAGGVCEADDLVFDGGTVSNTCPDDGTAVECAFRKVGADDFVRRLGCMALPAWKADGIDFPGRVDMLFPPGNRGRTGYREVFSRSAGFMFPRGNREGVKCRRGFPSADFVFPRGNRRRRGGVSAVFRTCLDVIFADDWLFPRGNVPVARGRQEKARPKRKEAGMKVARLRNSP